MNFLKNHKAKKEKASQATTVSLNQVVEILNDSKAREKAEAAAQQAELTAEAGAVSIESFNAAIKNTIKYVGDYKTSLAQQHLNIAENLAAQLGPEAQQAIEEGFTQTLESSTKAAKKNIQSDGESLARINITMLKTSARHIEGANIDDALLDLRDTALDAAAKDAKGDYTNLAASALDLVQHLTRSLPAERKEGMEEGLVKVRDAALESAEKNAKGDYPGFADSDMRLADRVSSLLPPTRKLETKGALTRVFNAAVKTAEKDAKQDFKNLASDMLNFARSVQGRINALSPA